ncbi:UBX domain-containing protein 8-like [Asterias rubens]|uniref:UBX domain-containing protein 8-like n=1 Tax=Asterias rubens TaxID=7604 RepID=UPI001455479D|nr:UBX domain-containing protein 8-like [Asterias rubens]
MARPRNRQHDDGWKLLCSFSAVMFVLVLVKLDFRYLIRMVTLCLLVLGFFTFFLYLVGDKLQMLWSFFVSSNNTQGQELSDKEKETERRKAREKIQNEYTEKGARYEEEVLKPREEAEKARLEEEFNKFAGPAWKGKSNRLGDGKEPNEDERPVTDSGKPVLRKRVQGTSKDASAVRKLPESVTRPPPVEPDQPKPQKRVVILPEEPNSNEKECITIRMRGLQSTIRTRRFLYINKVQVLLDWMTKQGYHPQLYTVCTTFPRMDLSEHVDKTLEDIELCRDVTLIIEEKL